MIGLELQCVIATLAESVRDQSKQIQLEKCQQALVKSSKARELTYCISVAHYNNAKKRVYGQKNSVPQAAHGASSAPPSAFAVLVQSGGSCI